MCIGDCVTDPCIEEEAVQRRRVAALGEPEAIWLRAKDPPVMFDACTDLRHSGRQIGLGQR